MSLIQIFARPPVPGRVKSRLAADIGNDKAALVYIHCLKYNLDLVRKTSLPHEVWLSEATEDHIFSEFDCQIQSGENLGDRMFHAIDNRLQNSIFDNQIVLIGTDCLELCQLNLTQAIDALSNNDLVFVPAIDGGFALIGCSKIDPLLFSDVAWGGSEVLNKTLVNAKQLNFSYQLLDSVRDIDRLDDLNHYPDLIELI
ncbi:MAG: rSAM/selenodomain-associated transferase 1 [Gammaproteobacteria bacterium]|jgi:rSAM/selenodomain-associated transferase 1